MAAQQCSAALLKLTYRESLRAHQAKLYRLGIRGNIANSARADASEHFAVELEQAVYALDTTTI